MKKKTKATLTTRQKASRKINRQRQWRKWWQVSQRFLVLSITVFTLAVSGAGWWFWHSGRLGQAAQAASDGFWAATARCGFKVEHVYLEGRSFTPLAEVNAALSLHAGDPILALNLSDMRSRLIAVPRVKNAQVTRALPNQLHVRIIERQPIAIWQHAGKLHLIDDNGIVMEYADPAKYSRLLVVIGKDAPAQAHALLAAMALTPDLYKDVASATRVGERRWNVSFRSGALLKLPEENAEQAWQNFARMQREQHLLERSVKSIDMRLADRVFIQLEPAALPTKAEKQGGKET